MRSGLELGTFYYYYLLLRSVLEYYWKFEAVLKIMSMQTKEVSGQV